MNVPDTLVTAFILRRRILDLLQGEISLLAFEDWFTESTWDEADVSLDALELSRRIELLLAEFTSGAWTWPEVREQLRDLACTAVVAWGAPENDTGSSVSASCTPDGASGRILSTTRIRLITPSFSWSALSHRTAAVRNGPCSKTMGMARRLLPASGGAQLLTGGRQDRMRE
jgi:hypothetical protein